MKAYLVTTGSVFTLLTGAHLWRMIQENHDLAQTPWYLAITATAAGLAAWAWVLLRRMAQ